jgi:hypothetical protein
MIRKASRKVMVVLILAIAFVAIFFLSARKPQRTVVRAVQSSEGETAEILAYKDNWLLGLYRADLVVQSHEGQMLLKTNLLVSREAIEDVSAEFSSMEIRDGKFC